MIDQEQAARTLINLIDVVHQENWVLLNNEDMASKTEEYYINFFKEHHLEEAIDEIATMAFLMNEQTNLFFKDLLIMKKLTLKKCVILWNLIVLSKVNIY